MEIQRESIFISSIRSLFKTFCGVIGFFLAFLPVIIIMTAMGVKQDHLQKNKLTILPDHNGEAKMLPLKTPAILQINIKGVIGVDKGVITKTIEDQLLESRTGLLKDNRVKGILLYVNTPGGSVFDSDDIYRLIKSYKKKYKLPVYTYVNGLCASGGMYIACSSDKIYASPVSVIGSVGVINGPFFNVYDFLKKNNVLTKTITQGKGKDAMSMFKPWAENEDDAIRPITEFFYHRFLNIVSTNRKIDKDKLINVYGARVFPVDVAKENGYIDVASVEYDEALLDLLKEAKIDKDKPYQIVTLKPKPKILDELMKGKFSLLKGKINHTFEMEKPLQRLESLSY
jgi:protease IV